MPRRALILFLVPVTGIVTWMSMGGFMDGWWTVIKSARQPPQSKYRWQYQYVDIK